MSIEQAWQKFNKQLLYYIQSRVKNIEDARDIHSTVYLKIIQNKEKLEHIENFHGWVYRIAKNSIIDYYRKYRNTNTNTEELKEELINNKDKDILDTISNEQ